MVIAVIIRDALPRLSRGLHHLDVEFTVVQTIPARTLTQSAFTLSYVGVLFAE